MVEVDNLRLTVALARHNAPIKPPISPAAPRGLRHCLKSITTDINTDAGTPEIVNNDLGQRKTRTCEIQIQNNMLPSKYQHFASELCLV